jgi:hypothetical protein
MALTIVASGCGSSSAPESTATASQTDSVAASEPAEPAVVTPPPAVRLLWLPGGELALENVDDETVSLQRAIAPAATAGSDVPGQGQARAEPDAAAFVLAVECAAVSADCVSLAPGAAIALGRWPDDLGRCRCPPCADISGASAGRATTEEGSPSLALVVRSCDASHVLPQRLPQRPPPL